jgi:hypothetical protein
MTPIIESIRKLLYAITMIAVFTLTSCDKFIASLDGIYECEVKHYRYVWNLPYLDITYSATVEVDARNGHITFEFPDNFSRTFKNSDINGDNCYVSGDAYNGYENFCITRDDFYYESGFDNLNGKERIEFTGTRKN